MKSSVIFTLNKWDEPFGSFVPEFTFIRVLERPNKIYQVVRDCNKLQSMQVLSVSDYIEVSGGGGELYAAGDGIDITANVITNIDKGSDVDLSNKQDKLVSGVNIKSINGNTLLGSGDIAISGEIDPSYELIKYYFI